MPAFRLKNFKCFRDTGWLELRPLTIVVGPNNSGKSALLQGLTLPAITARSGDSSTVLSLDSEGHGYGSYTDIVFEHDPTGIFTLEYRAEIDVLKKRQEVELTSVFALDKPRNRICLQKYSYHATNLGSDLSLEIEEIPRRKTPSLTNPKLEANDCARLARGLVRSNFMFFPEASPWAFESKLRRAKISEDRRKQIMDVAYEMAIVSGGFLNDVFGQVRHLGPVRKPPERIYPLASHVSDWLGDAGEEAFPKLAALCAAKRRGQNELLARINKELSRLGFIRMIKGKPIGSPKTGYRGCEFFTTHATSGLTASLADSGYGASQVLPVVMALLSASEKSILLFEQPEIHLHPAAQAELASVFVDALMSQRQLNTVVETHSESFILRTLREVASKRTCFSSSDVVFYYVNPKANGHEVITLSINDLGEFERAWPEGFFATNLIESKSLHRERMLQKQSETAHGN